MLTRLGSSWLVSNSCWLVLIRVDSCQARVDSSCFVSDSWWFVLTRVDLCWYSCIKIDLIHVGTFKMKSFPVLYDYQMNVWIKKKDMLMKDHLIILWINNIDPK